MADRRQLLKAAIALPVVSTGLAAASRAAADPIDQLVAAFVAEAGDVALSIGVVKDGKTRFFNRGTHVRGGGTRVDRHAVYEIGSITKTFTGLLLAHAIAEGRVKLADPVQRYLPHGYDNLARDGRAVTFADIVTTTSALPDNIPDWRVALNGVPAQDVPARYAALLEGYDSAAFLKDLRSAQLVDTPGHQTRHSNAASQLLAAVLERLYQQPYAQLVARYIETPFGMQRGTGAVPASLLVTGYDGVAMPPLTMAAIRAAGGLRYSAADMIRYITAQIAARDPAIAQTHVPLWGTADTQGIGFHWIVSKTADGIPYLQHSGGTFGFSSYCDFYPQQRYGIVLLVNRAGDYQYKLQQLANAIHDTLCGTPRGLRALETALERTDYHDASATIATIKARYPELHLDENRMNQWGGKLLAERRPQAAREIFAYTVAAFPDSGNAHDSYATALMETGDTADALREFRASLALDPSNQNAVEMIAKLSKAGTP
ncbi:serine hydrolase [Sphingomonas sp. MMS24-J45]|uniref:serine hydrolase n=1 Tax=Sphingomonas sp. MMS24-J45 TaxID=3238806 RepID=UPI00384AE522